MLAQLATFLIGHHHAQWAEVLPLVNPHRFILFFDWASRHGFAYQR